VNAAITDAPVDARLVKAARRPLLRLSIRQKNLGRLLFLAGAWLAVVASAILVFLAVLHSPAAVSGGLAAGALARWLGQRSNLKQLRTSYKPAVFANFEFQGEGFLCDIDEVELRRYISAWGWRIAAATASGGVCLALQHLAAMQFDMLPEFVRSLHWLYPVVESCALALPVFCCILFLQVKGPERYWVGQARAAIEARAAASASRILKPRELDGLAAGVEALWQALGLERRGEYREAIARHLSADAVAAALRPEYAESVLETMTELARQDIRDLSGSLEAYREAERHCKAMQMLAAVLKEPRQEMKAEELGAEIGRLSRLASERRWEDLRQRAAWIESELNSLRASLRQHASSVPPAVLAPGTDPYRVLGISVDTPTPLVRKLRLSLAQLYHPDISDSTRSSAKMAELNAAYDAVMKDREREGR
jgi:hypothetical protein